MPVASVSPSPEHLGKKPFSFFPAILNIEHNEWLFRRATWSEILVANAKMELEIWIPRRFLGEISSIEEPVMIVGLVKELEYKGGSIWPHEKRIIEMPRTSSESPAAGTSGRPMPATPSSSGTERRIGRLIAAALVAGIVITFIVVNVVSRNQRAGVIYSGREQFAMGLNRQDEYFAVVRKLGPPLTDRWRSEQGELQYRILSYPAFSIILMGSERKDAHYIGALDKNWKVIDSVELPNGGNTASMLRALPRF
jgi:hypothetical protein